MKEALRKFREHIFNPEIRLQRRLFQLLSVIALAEFVLVSLYTFLSSDSIGHKILMITGTVLFAFTVAMTFKTGKMRLGSFISSLLYFLMYPLTFFSSGGMYGGAPPVFAFAMVYVFLVTESWERILSLALCVLMSFTCYYLSYTKPEMLIRHTVLAEHVESMLAVLLVALLVSMLLWFVQEVYRTENKIVQKQKKEIEDLHQAQKRFFSSMSHEIRTPVNAVIGLNEANLRISNQKEVKENCRNIESAGRTLLHTVNEILDMSKLETGGMEIVPQEYQTTSMLSDIVNMIWYQASEKGLDFTVRADPALPSVLFGDEVRIRQILLNVVSNAVKYTKEGTVSLTICGERCGDDRIVMMYEVKDTGIGIRAENIPYLFDAFQRMDQEKTHAIEGTGLGLSIVKQLLDLMGGSVRVSSEYGKGSLFHIEVPQKIIRDDPIGQVDFLRREEEVIASEDAVLDGENLRILAVDDTPMNLLVVKKLLKDTGTALDTASGGNEALFLTAANRYDVIIMDHQMPEMDGIECMHRIKSQENGQCRDSRFICLTANAGAEMEAMYLREGFDAFLLKPVHGKALVGALKEVLENGRL